MSNKKHDKLMSILKSTFNEVDFKSKALDKLLNCRNHKNILITGFEKMEQFLMLSAKVFNSNEVTTYKISYYLIPEDSESDQYINLSPDYEYIISKLNEL